MVISRKLIKPLHPPLEMNSQILQQGTNHKHLGLFFSNNGLWHDHIDYIVKKAYTRYNKNRRGPNKELWGTPAFIVFHSEFDPLKTTQ
jgi:hypothetical protein